MSNKGGENVSDEVRIKIATVWPKYGVPKGEIMLHYTCKACEQHPGVIPGKAMSRGSFDKHVFMDPDPTEDKKMGRVDRCPASLPLIELRNDRKHNIGWFSKKFGPNYLKEDEQILAYQLNRDPRYDIWEDYDFHGRNPNWKVDGEEDEKKDELKVMKELADNCGVPLEQVLKWKEDSANHPTTAAPPATATSNTADAAAAPPANATSNTADADANSPPDDKKEKSKKRKKPEAKGKKPEKKKKIVTEDDVDRMSRPELFEFVEANGLQVAKNYSTKNLIKYVKKNIINKE